jgi:hypothetical protein
MQLSDDAKILSADISVLTSDPYTRLTRTLSRMSPYGSHIIARSDTPSTSEIRANPRQSLRGPSRIDFAYRVYQAY